MAKKKAKVRADDEFGAGDISPDEVRDVAMRLRCAFTWNRTKEGHAYWSRLCTRLERMARSAQSEEG